LGDPVIKYETIEQVLKRGFTELFIHFSWQGVSRVAGLLKNIDHYNVHLRNTARSAVQTLNAYLTPEWQEIQKNVKSHSERRKRFVSLYESKLKQYYPGVKYVEIPIGSRNPDYYLFFTTRHSVGYRIMDEIIEKMRRKGVEPLDKFR
jgi:three-Cys-motif partner protein